jgi:hypothetical protein
VIYEYGEPRWNYIDRGKTPYSSIRALWHLYQQSSTVHSS